MPVRFELVSPERLIVSAEVDMVVVPGTEGNFGVLPGHSPLISTIRPGTIDIYQGGAVSERIFIVGGIAEVTPERCTVLADEALAPSDLSRAEIEADLQTIESNLPSLGDHLARAQGTERDQLATELRRLERQQSVARAKLQALAEIAH
jgi:F-type H+-transporting ATPase subunit epsilon